jgi:hypothetical protein
MNYTNELLDLAIGYQQWEADLILSDQAWGGGMEPLPTLTQELYDGLMDLQRRRNAIITSYRAEWNDDKLPVIDQ